jgi:hypothetical protein
VSPHSRVSSPTCAPATAGSDAGRSFERPLLDGRLPACANIFLRAKDPRIRGRSPNASVKSAISLSGKQADQPMVARASRLSVTYCGPNSAASDATSRSSAWDADMKIDRRAIPPTISPGDRRTRPTPRSAPQLQIREPSLAVCDSVALGLANERLARNEEQGQDKLQAAGAASAIRVGLHLESCYRALGARPRVQYFPFDGVLPSAVARPVDVGRRSTPPRRRSPPARRGQGSP